MRKNEEKKARHRRQQNCSHVSFSPTLIFKQRKSSEQLFLRRSWSVTKRVANEIGDNSRSCTAAAAAGTVAAVAVAAATGLSSAVLEPFTAQRPLFQSVAAPVSLLFSPISR